MIARRTLLATGLALSAGRAFAMDPGTASGRYQDDDVKLGFSHAIALLQDNAEGMLDRPHQMRVLLSDVEVAPAALYGIVFPPVRAMAREGKVKGVLVEFDPADKTSALITVLSKPADPSVSFANITRSDSTGLWKRLDVSDTRVSGEFKPDDDGHLVMSFSAPVFTDPVQQDLKGAAAQQSELIGVLIARAQAMAKGDRTTAYSLSTEASVATIKSFPPGMEKAMAGQIPVLIKSLKSARRVVIRRETAAVLTPDGSWFNLAREGGAWKAAD